MPNLMMAVGMDMVSKLRAFNDIDDNYSLAVNLGYFYGFLRLHLSTITSIKNANEIIEMSLNNLKEATEGKVSLENFNYIIKTNYNNAFENIQRSANDNNIIDFASQLYLNDLYQKEVVDNVKLLVAKNNITLLYGMITKLTANMKIV